MTQIAYLIHAHNEPELCLRLINKLQSENSHFFIHWDKKSNESFQKFKALSLEVKNLKLYSQFEMYWMGYSLVEATIFLMQKVFEHTDGIKYAVLLSGQDYPIKSIGAIKNFFETNDRDFISLNKLKDMEGNFIIKTESHHFLENNLWNPKSSTKNKLLYRLYFGIYRNRVIKYLPKRKMFNNWTPFFGSQWFALTSATCLFILDFIKRNPGYCRFMKTVEAPDEIFFQTIIGNTELLNRMSEASEYHNHANQGSAKPQFHYRWGSLRFMDWESPGRAKPAILDMRDLDTLMYSHLLFCRKVSMLNPDSSKLLQKIDSLV